MPHILHITCLLIALAMGALFLYMLYCVLVDWQIARKNRRHERSMKSARDRVFSPTLY